jgi:hypothetical protein
MANTVKEDKMKTENEVMTEKKAKSEKQSFDPAEMMALFKSMNEEIAKLRNDLDQTRAERDIAMNRRSSTLEDEITIICAMIGGSVRGEFPTWKLSLTRYGQKYTLTRRQFQELVNTKRAWFRKQYIVLDPKHIDLAEENDIAVMDLSSNEFINPKDIATFGDMSDTEIKAYYDKLSAPMKKSFANYFFNKCCEKDPKFYTVAKMNTINMLIGGTLFDNLISVCMNEQNRK